MNNNKKDPVFDPRDGQIKMTDNPALILRDVIAQGGAIALPADAEMKIIDLANFCEKRVTDPGEQNRLE